MSEEDVLATLVRFTSYELKPEAIAAGLSDQSYVSSIVVLLSFILTTALDYTAWIWDVILSILPDYIDSNFLGWVIWLFTPIVVSFLLPVVILILVYFSALVIHIYKYRHRLQDAYAQDFWDGAKSFLATAWDGHGWIWHGYEIIGIENIPKNALLIYYHGALPIDIYYLMAKFYLYKGQVIHAVGDRFLFKVPGLKLLLEVFKVTPGSVDACAKTLQTGLLTISPGGLLEAQYGDHSYELMWGNRLGFAKAALKAKVPIVPIFTRNVRESFRNVSFGKRFFRKLYNKYKLPFVPVYGGFPVKMQTFVGKPIPYDPSLTPKDLAEKTAASIRELIATHQRVPGCIFSAILDRFH